MSRRAPLLALVFALALVPPAGADECVPTTSNPEVDTDPLNTGRVPRFYVDNDFCQPDCMFSIWFYQETNGIDGLQRGSWYDYRDDTCGGQIEPDMMIG